MMNANGVCSQTAILTADQCNVMVQAKWDVTKNQCIQYLTSDAALSETACTSAHPASDAATQWTWVATSTDPDVGICVETVAVTTTAAQCTALSGTWTYDTTVSPPACKQTTTLSHSLDQCQAMSGYTWDTNSNTCIQTVMWDLSKWTALQTKCTSVSGYYWIPDSLGSTAPPSGSGVCKPVSALTQQQCADLSGESLPLAWSTKVASQGMCITANTGEELCRMVGTASLAACTSAAQTSYCSSAPMPWDGVVA